MNICIIGGGHLGTTIAGDLAYHFPEYNISLLTSKPTIWDGIIKVNDIELNNTYEGRIKTISSSPIGTIDSSDIVFITVPSFMVEKTLSQIDEYLKPGCYVGVIPGSGGCEFYWSKMKSKNTCTFFGLGRVPYTCKYKVYGKETNLKSKKKQLLAAAIPCDKSKEVCSLMEHLFRIPCIETPNYLNITLTPTNPVLHTSRTYGIFSKKEKGDIFNQKLKFYADWTDDDSRMLIGVDNELQKLCRALNKMDLSEVISLREYYESSTPEQLTQKIHSIETFKSVYAPLLPHDNGFFPDENSRMFIEDFPFGLCIIKGFCEIAGIDTPYIDTLIKWYEKYKNVEYFTEKGYCGKDLIDTGCPQNFGIDSVDKIYNFYL